MVIALLAQSLNLTPALADSIDRAAILRSSVSPGDALILTEPHRDSVAGTLVELRGADRLLVLKVFDPSSSRFNSEEIPLVDILSLTRVTTHRPDAYPILGGVAGGALGALFGYHSGHSGYDGGDVYSEDTRPGRALGFGLGGAVLGMLLGTVFAPTRKVSTVLW